MRRGRSCIASELKLGKERLVVLREREFMPACNELWRRAVSSSSSCEEREGESGERGERMTIPFEDSREGGVGGRSID